MIYMFYVIGEPSNRPMSRTILLKARVRVNKDIDRIKAMLYRIYGREETIQVLPMRACDWTYGKRSFGYSPDYNEICDLMERENVCNTVIRRKYYTLSSEDDPLPLGYAELLTARKPFKYGDAVHWSSERETFYIHGKRGYRRHFDVCVGY